MSDRRPDIRPRPEARPSRPAPPARLTDAVWRDLRAVAEVALRDGHEVRLYMTGGAVGVRVSRDVAPPQTLRTR